jgi:hypothetical protein
MTLLVLPVIVVMRDLGGQASSSACHRALLIEIESRTPPFSEGLSPVLISFHGKRRR